MNGNSGIADITMKEAVEFLSSENEHYQYCGTSYIQHRTYTDDNAKEEVVHLIFYVFTLSHYCCLRSTFTWDNWRSIAKISPPYVF